MGQRQKRPVSLWKPQRPEGPFEKTEKVLDGGCGPALEGLLAVERVRTWGVEVEWKCCPYLGKGRTRAGTLTRNGLFWEHRDSRDRGTLPSPAHLNHLWIVPHG